MTPTSDQLVSDYLERLERELRDVPSARRREIVEEVSQHIREARAAGAGDEASVRSLLDRLGDPADIAAEAQERFDVRPRRAGLLEIAALVLLLVGGVLLPVLGWFVGVALLWASTAWTTRDKLVGTLVVPGGLALPFFLAMAPVYGGGGSCVEEIDPETLAPIPGTEVCTETGGPSEAMQILGPILFVAVLVAPLVTTIYLARRMRPQEAAAQGGVHAAVSVWWLLGLAVGLFALVVAGVFLASQTLVAGDGGGGGVTRVPATTSTLP